MKDLLKTDENILEEIFIQLEFLIKNSKMIEELTNGMVDTSKICDFRTGMYIVYLSDLNTGILENVSLSQLEMFLDKGLFNEFMCDQKTYILNVKYNLVD